MKIKIEFRTDDDAMIEDFEGESKLILEQVHQLINGSSLNNSLMDSNGNTIGFVSKVFPKKRNKY